MALSPNRWADGSAVRARDHVNTQCFSFIWSPIRQAREPIPDNWPSRKGCKECEAGATHGHVTLARLTDVDAIPCDLPARPDVRNRGVGRTGEERLRPGWGAGARVRDPPWWAAVQRHCVHRPAALCQGRRRRRSQAGGPGAGGEPERAGGRVVFSRPLPCQGLPPQGAGTGLEIDGHFKAYPFAELAKPGAALLRPRHARRPWRTSPLARSATGLAAARSQCVSMPTTATPRCGTRAASPSHLWWDSGSPGTPSTLTPWSTRPNPDKDTLPCMTPSHC